MTTPQTDLLPPATCPLCRASDYDIIYDLTTAHSHEDIPGLVVRCRACAMWFKMLSDPAGLPTAYPGEYGDDPVAETYLRGPAARLFFRDILAKTSASSSGARRKNSSSLGFAPG